MTIEEAEVFFKQYNGLGFHMCRDNPSMYSEFQKMQISDEITENWRKDIIDRHFDVLFIDMEQVWWKHSSIIDIMFNVKGCNEENCIRLLAEMEKMAVLSKMQKILIIEKMAGRTVPQKDGGCYYVCTNSSQEVKMNQIMNQIMNFTCDSNDNVEESGWDNMQERYLKAVNAYKTAFAKFAKLR